MALLYKQEYEFLKNTSTEKDTTGNRAVLAAEELKNILEKYPAAPHAYIAYLQEIGPGNIRELQFKVYPSLFSLTDLGLNKQYDLEANILFFGDNFCGDFSGFDLDLNDGRVVELWHETGELYYTQQSFQPYIRQQMLMDENGRDLRVK